MNYWLLAHAIFNCKVFQNEQVIKNVQRGRALIPPWEAEVGKFILIYLHGNGMRFCQLANGFLKRNRLPVAYLERLVVLPPQKTLNQEGSGSLFLDGSSLWGPSALGVWGRELIFIVGDGVTGWTSLRSGVRRPAPKCYQPAIWPQMVHLIAFESRFSC